MSESLLLKRFDLLATASGGVARLRELILTLAVQGKLVPQERRDEPASLLLKKMRAEKDHLIAQGVIRPDKQLAEIEDDEKPFALPLGWEWARLPAVTYNLGQGAPSARFTYIDIASVDNKNAKVTDAVQVLEAADAPSRARKNVALGTVLYSTVRPYLKNIAMVESQYSPPAIASTAFAVMHPHEGLLSRYLLHYLRSGTFTQYVSSRAVGIAYPAINDASFFQGVIALPPRNEQARIVARVGELMKLCDALELNGRLADEQHTRLTTTLFDALAASESAHALAENWQRVAEHFDLLLDRPEAVDALEQTILQLAVRGLLVHQDPRDAPASRLLKEIGKRKTALIANRTLKIGQLTADSKSISQRANIPETWTWTKGIEILFITKLAGFEYTKHFSLQDDGDIPVVRAQNVRPFTLSTTNLKYIDSQTSQVLERCALTKSALLVTFIGAGIGDVALFEKPERWHLAPNVAKMEPFTGCEGLLNLRYLSYFLNSSPGRQEIFKHIQSTAQPSISMGTIRDIDFPVPPLAEQARIVDRVDSLRRLCGDLRERIIASRVHQAQLAQVLIEQQSFTSK